MKFTSSILGLVLVASACGGSTSPTQNSSTTIQQLHKSLRTPDEAVELPFTWGQPTTSPLTGASSNVAIFTFSADPPDPQASIERIVIEAIHSDSQCPADFQITLIAPSGRRFVIWNNEGACAAATRNDDMGGSMAVNTFVSGREVSGAAGEPLCTHCTNPAASPDDHWKWQVTTRGQSQGTAVGSSHPPAPLSGEGDLGMTVTFYYTALYRM